MNNKERELWVLNDEGLYFWWKDSRLSMVNFLKKNRENIDQIINSILSPKDKYYGRPKRT